MTTTYYVIQPILSDRDSDTINDEGWGCPLGRAYLALTDFPTEEGMVEKVGTADDHGILRQGWVIEADSLADVFMIGNGMGDTEGHREARGRSVSVGDAILWIEDGITRGKLVASSGFIDLPAEAVDRLAPHIRRRAATDEEIAAAMERTGCTVSVTRHHGNVWRADLKDRDGKVLRTRFGLTNEKAKMRDDLLSTVPGLAGV